MKKAAIVCAAWVSLLAASCNNEGLFQNESAHGAKEDSARGAGAPVLARDNSITASNAYSDLFLDSALVEQYIQKKKVDGATASDLRNFYNSRNYQYAWFSSDGFTEQGRGLWNLYSGDGQSQTDSSAVQDRAGSSKEIRAENKKLINRMDTLVVNDSLQVTATDSSFIETELALTRHFMQHARQHLGVESGDPSSVRFYVPAKKMDVLQLADSVLKTKHSVQEANRPYSLMKEQLARYHGIAQNGGWQPIALNGARLRKGVSAPVVTQLKKRLKLTGELSGSDTSAVYNDSLEAAIRSFQVRHGFKADGMLSDSVVQVLNVPVQQRIAQILVNMNRMLWMPSGNKEQVIEVNIPAFMLQVHEGDSTAFAMDVIVGKEGTNTMMFTGNMNQIVFSPYWNIPASIVRDELLPAMKKNGNYLKSRNMEIVRQNGDLPEIRQKPGPWNSLGKAKFLFPNSYDIYLHDTPNKELFAQDKRAFSHGCIRLADAAKMAAYLLRNESDWTPEKIQEAMNSGKEQYVKLSRPVPVVITYFTAWVDNNGQMQFREDIYGHDRRTAQKMFGGTI